MINCLLEKVIRCAQMSVDCLRASKLVTLGYILQHYVYVGYSLIEVFLTSDQLLCPKKRSLQRGWPISQ